MAREVTTGLGVGAGIFLGGINGAYALSAIEEIKRGSEIVNTLEAQGLPQAAEWQAYTADKVDDRNLSLLLVASGIGVAAMSTAAAGRRKSATS